MAVLDFPASPTNGQLYPAAPNAQYIYNSTAGGPSVGAWESLPMQSAKTVTDDVAPLNPADGDQWFSTVDGVLYIYVVDVDGGQWVESRAPITANGYYSPNYIINGAFDIWQRGTSFTNINTYCADRWMALNSGAVINVTRETFPVGQTDVDGNPSYFLRFAVTTGNDYARLVQRIEDVKTLSGKTVTVSFWAKGTNPGGGKVYIGYDQASGGTAGQTNYAAADITLTASWQRFSKTITIPALSGTVVDANSYMSIIFGQGADTSTSAWTMDIANVQLEAGAIATTFRRNANSIQGELAACQRYYFRNTGTQYAAVAVGFSINTTNGRFVVHLPVEMRSNPTSIEYSNLRQGDTNTFGPDVTSISFYGSSKSAVSVGTASSAGGLVANRPLFLLNENVNGGFIAFSAEL